MDQDEELSDKSRPTPLLVRREYGTYAYETDAVQEAVGKAIAGIAHRRVNEYIPAENTRRFNHGTAWSSPAKPELGQDEMVTISNKSLMKWVDIVDHNLLIIGDTIVSIGNDMADQQIRAMFQSVSSACDRSGNVVDGAERPIADAFMEMLEKIEFGVDASGEVSLPSIYVPPAAGQQMIGELEGQPEEYQQRMRDLIESKKAAALEAERARLARFRAPPT